MCEAMISDWRLQSWSYSSSFSNGILLLVENESVSKVKYGLGYLILRNIGRFQNLSTTQSCPWNLPCFCPIPWSAEYFGFTTSKLELDRPQDVHYNCQSIQAFGYKFCSIGRTQNARHFNLLVSVNFLALKPRAWKTWEPCGFASHVILISVLFFGHLFPFKLIRSSVLVWCLF